MTHKTLLSLAALALVPAMVGPLPAAAAGLVVPLCGGGAVSVPTGPSEPPGPVQGPCCAKGCHTSRKRLDRTQ